MLDNTSVSPITYSTGALKNEKKNITSIYSHVCRSNTSHRESGGQYSRLISISEIKITMQWSSWDYQVSGIPVHSL